MKHDFAFVVSCHSFFVFVCLFLLTSISRYAFAQRFLISAWGNLVVDDGKIFVLLPCIVPYIFWAGI